MPILKNHVTLKAMMSMNIVNSTRLEDKFGNPVVLSPDGRIFLNGVAEPLTVHKAARLHNFLMNNIDKPTNGWKYWMTTNPSNGERISLDVIRKYVYQVYIVEKFEKLLASI